MATACVQRQHLALGGFLIVVAGLLAAGAAGLPLDKGYNVLGPQVFPFAVAGFLGAVGVWLCAQAFTGGYRHLPAAEAPAPDRLRWQASAWVSGGVVAIALLITTLGFVLAAGVLFACAARGFGSRQPAKDLARGMALALPVFWIFTAGLGLSLPHLVNGWI